MLMIRFVLILLFSLFTSFAYAQKSGAPEDQKEKNILSQLDKLHYWVYVEKPLRATENYQAIIAFQKIQKLKRTGKITDQLIKILDTAKIPVARDSLHKKHIEVDLNHQVLYIIDSNDCLERILTVSTGNGKKFMFPDKGWEYANTPRGKFKVKYKIKGWKKSELGLLLNPLYITGGVAIHGAPSVPPIPASHGCIRIPIFASKEIYTKIPTGTPVTIYGNNPKPN